MNEKSLTPALRTAFLLDLNHVSRSLKAFSMLYLLFCSGFKKYISRLGEWRVGHNPVSIPQKRGGSSSSHVVWKYHADHMYHLFGHFLLLPRKSLARDDRLFQYRQDTVLSVDRFFCRCSEPEFYRSICLYCWPISSQFN